MLREYENKLADSFSINNKFLELLSEINFSNQSVNPRGLKVKEALITGFAIDTQYPCIDFEDRPFNWKYFLGETAWYLLGSNKTELIDKFSSFWKNIKNEDGSVNSNYGKILLHNQTNDHTQMAWVVNSLKKDKESRQAIAYVGDSKFQYDGNKDFVCTQYLNFFIRNNELHIKVQMRSNDIFYGLTFDAPWFSTVHQNVFLELKETYPELTLGKYFHFSDNSHFYERHFELADKLLKNNIYVKAGPKLELLEPVWLSTACGKTTLSNTAHKFLEWVADKEEKISDLTTEDYIKGLSILFKITLPE